MPIENHADSPGAGSDAIIVAVNPFLKFLASVAIGLAIAVAATPRTIDTTAYPRKPLTLVVAYSPGGAVDNIARAVAQSIEPYLGQRVVVQNKPGAGGEIGYRSLALSASDGYTIGMITSPPILMLGKLREESGFDISDLEPLAGLQKDPVVLAVRADSSYLSFADLMTAARASYQPLNVAGDGPNSNNQLQLVVTEKMLEVDFNFVPFNGSGPSITALLGNQVEVAVPSASSATAYVLRGEIRILAVFSPDRYQYLPGAPTILEASGVAVPDIGAAVRGVVVPRGMAPARKQVLADVFQQLATDDSFAAHANQLMLPLYFMNAEQFEEYLDDAEILLNEYAPLLHDQPEP